MPLCDTGIVHGAMKILSKRVHRKLFSFKSYGNYLPLNEVLKKQDNPPPSFSTFLNNRRPNMYAPWKIYKCESCCTYRLFCEGPVPVSGRVGGTRDGPQLAFAAEDPLPQACDLLQVREQRWHQVQGSVSTIVWQTSLRFRQGLRLQRTSD